MSKNEMLAQGTLRFCIYIHPKKETDGARLVAQFESESEARDYALAHRHSYHRFCYDSGALRWYIPPTVINYMGG